jgi:hypothetical protein
MTNRLFILVFFLGLVGNPLYSQCLSKNKIAAAGEEATYAVFYNLGFVWMNAAEVSFSTKLTKYQGKNAFLFISKGQTLPNFDWLFKVRDSFQSIADTATLQPYWFRRDNHEGNYSVKSTQVFDYINKKAFCDVTTSKTALKRDTLPLKGCVLDVLTAIYASRNIEFNHLNKNDLIPLSILIDNQIFPLYIRYLGPEIILNHDNKKFACQKFSILLVEGTIFSGGEDMTVWVSDDLARVPIRVEAKILIGSVVANVSSFKGTKYPMTSEIITSE